jgi:hypothetical protein
MKGRRSGRRADKTVRQREWSSLFLGERRRGTRVQASVSRPVPVGPPRRSDVFGQRRLPALSASKPALQFQRWNRASGRRTRDVAAYRSRPLHGRAVAERGADDQEGKGSCGAAHPARAVELLL